MRSTSLTRRPRRIRALTLTAAAGIIATLAPLVVTPTASAAPVTAAPVTAGAAMAQSAAACAPFDDVGSANQHCDNIAWLKTQHITRPVDGHFRPAAPVSRQAMAAFLYRLVHPGAAAPKCTEPPFSDVATGSAPCGYIEWAADHGVTSGYSDGTYRPARPVTRGAMAAFLHRITDPGAATATCTRRPFSDVATTGTFCSVITWMHNSGVTDGYPDGTFGPGRAVSRAAMASFLHRIADDVGDVDSASAIRPAKLEAPSNNAGSSKPDQDYATTGADHPITDAILAGVNKIRSDAGARPVTVNSGLESYALHRSQQQTAAKKMSHDGFHGITGSLFHMGFTTLAENVAYNYASVAAVLSGWRHSPGHYQNMVNPAFTKMGVAVSYSATGRPYYTMLLAG